MGLQTGLFHFWRSLAPKILIAKFSGIPAYSWVVPGSALGTVPGVRSAFSLSAQAQNVYASDENS